MVELCPLVFESHFIVDTKIHPGRKRKQRRINALKKLILLHTHKRTSKLKHFKRFRFNNMCFSSPDIVQRKTHIVEYISF